MQLSHFVNTYGQWLHQKYGCKVHKISINAGFTCPNRDGSKGIGGCTFCNNASFSPNARAKIDVEQQIQAGKAVLAQKHIYKYLAYFQAYTNTYGDVHTLRNMYELALKSENIIGLSIGTRPDCVPNEVLDLLCHYRDQGLEVCLELGLQSAFDISLQRVNRGHGWKEYEDTVKRAQKRQLKICTHLIVGLPGEIPTISLLSLKKVLDLGTNGLKIHPLHIVKGSALANEYRRGLYTPINEREYIETVVTMIQRTPADIPFHRLTGTARNELLLAPSWCSGKWRVLNEITAELMQSGAQGSALATSRDVDLHKGHQNRHTTTPSSTLECIL